jgi:hypothetical protein
MKDFIQPYFTWTNFLLAAIALWGVFWLLRFLRQRMRNGVLFGRYQQPVTDGISTFLLLYEPFTILLLTLVFFFINPIMHGILLLLLGIASFGRIRDYLSGRIILAASLVEEGKRMETLKASGVISRVGRIGLYLQTGDSLQFINYSSLLIKGYTVTTGEEIGGYYQLYISVEGDEPPADALGWLADRFVSTPYLARSFKPELKWADDQANHISARVSVREEQHLRELLELMGEWGFPATIARK